MKKSASTTSFLKMLLILVSGLIVASCTTRKMETPKPLPVGGGHLKVEGGSIWYKVSGTGKGTPLVLLHGGPGYSSYYLKPFEDLGNDRQVIRYDQLGGGKSDKITDTNLFKISHFVRELDSLRVSLGIDRWHILGHSWGTILAAEYYKVHPECVASLTLGSACLDIAVWEKNAKQLVTTLSDSSQRAIRKAEATQNFDDPLYQNAINEFFGIYVWRHPVKDDLDSTLVTFNPAIYNYMQGPSEFDITGTLKNYDATPLLNQIRVPVLYTRGEYDEASLESIQRFASLTKDARVVTFKGAAHLTPWDARDENVSVVRDFLRSVDSAAAKGGN